MRIADLFREHNRALVAFLQCRLHSLSDAQEVAQEAYVRLVTMDKPEQVDSLRAYLFRIASNLAVDRLRARQVRADHPIHAPDDDLHLAVIDGRADAIVVLENDLYTRTGAAWACFVPARPSRA